MRPSLATSLAFIAAAAAAAAAAACAAAGSALAQPRTQAQPPPIDRLDLPAERSALAPRRLLTAVGAAGGRLVAVGERGHALRSDDGGASWEQGSVPVSSDLTSLCLLSPELGWAAGHDGVVLTTSDGGLTWARQLDGRQIGPLLAAAYRDAPPGPLREQVALLVSRGVDQPFLDLWFEDARTGFAVGAFNLVLRTGDGGRSWTPWLERTENPEALHLHAVRRVAGDLWIVGERGLVLRLDPAAGRFAAVPVPYRGSFFGVTGAGRTVVLFGLRGTALRSRDRGASWERVETGLEVALVAGTALPGGRIALVAQDGRVLLSRDEGETFRPVPVPVPAPGPAAAAAPAGPGALVVTGPAGARVVPL